MYTRSGKRGFTLVELLIATAIFALLMSAIAALFVASLHAVRSGYQAQEAYETARGAFNVVERDLTTVFTSRDFGQYYQFYGNEYGMMMVGLIRLRDASGREYTRLGRISYVIYPVVIRTADGRFYVTDPFSTEYAREVGVSADALAAQGLFRSHGIRQLGASSDTDESEVCVAALVRYVEPGVSDLDTYPFDWNGIADFYDGNPEFPATGSSDTIRAQLDDALTFSSTDANQLARMTNPREQIFAAKKRDLWLRMLSCQQYWIPKLTQGKAILPNIWGRLGAGGTVADPGWLQPILSIGKNLTDADRGTYPELITNPRDYIVAESIGVNSRTQSGVVGESRYPLRPYTTLSTDNIHPFFEFGAVGPDSEPHLMPYWNANNYAFVTTNFLTDGLDNDGDGVVDESDEGQYVLPYPNQFTIEQMNIPTQTVDDARSYGSPLQPRLPEVVKVRLPMIYSPAYLNAPHFERKMEQLIDVPTAFTRSLLATQRG